jgi:LacI family transcriptional regulator
LNHSPAAQIKRIKLEKIRTMLLETELTIEEIAQKTGFVYVENMIPLFRRNFGTTPAQFRRNQTCNTTNHPYNV